MTRKNIKADAVTFDIKNAVELPASSHSLKTQSDLFISNALEAMSKESARTDADIKRVAKKLVQDFVESHTPTPVDGKNMIVAPHHGELVL